MKKFEVGKSYGVNDGRGGVVTVVKRTKCYVTLSGGIYSGRYAIRQYGNNGFFGLGEHVITPWGVFIFAGRVVVRGGVVVRFAEN